MLITSVTQDALFGALLGGTFSLLGTLLALREQRKDGAASERAQLLAMVTALREELRTILHRFELAWAAAFVDRQPGTPITAEFGIGEDYLAVFHAHAGQLGRLGDADTVRALVHATVSIKGLFDAVRSNNEMVRLTLHGRLDPSDVADLERRARVEQALGKLTRYGDVLAGSVVVMREATEAAIALLDRREADLRGLPRAVVEAPRADAPVRAAVAS